VPRERFQAEPQGIVAGNSIHLNGIINGDSEKKTRDPSVASLAAICGNNGRPMRKRKRCCSCSVWCCLLEAPLLERGMPRDPARRMTRDAHP
jgi:hypothetical protein